MSAPDRVLRRGLPRTPGGAPWPDGSLVAHQASEQPASATVASPGAVAAVTAASDPPEPTHSHDGPVRRGLPRESGGPPWPPTSLIAAAEPVVETPTPAPPNSTSQTPRRRTRAPRVVLAAVALAVLAAGAVLAVRWLVGLEGVRAFLATHPGEYELAEGAPVGLPAWLGWQHFFNAFFLVLIVRTGLQIRYGERPSAFWTSRRTGTKVNLAVWLHQSLDLLWVINGLLYIALLFATGQWVRVTPTSWEVFPNALSALLQYISLDWPTENGWTNYNSLQQLAYSLTIFVAAPLAMASGLRMSTLWPRNRPTLDRIYPIGWARRLHFPVMLYFVAFTVAHLTLVLATGALRNLNHMYTSRDVIDGIGLAVFAGSLLVTSAVWLVLRPAIVAQVARLFGVVSSR